MDRRTEYESREEQAKAEVGVTAIARPVAICAVVMFLASVIVAPMIDQLARGWRTWQVLAGSAEIRQRLRGFESALEDESVTARAVRPAVERVLAVGGASGVERIYLGREGWLFYEPDVRHVMGSAANAARWGKEVAPRRPDAVAAILDFKKQLAAREIALVIVPTPVKPAVQPEMLWTGTTGPLVDGTFERFVREIEAGGVPVFDPTAAILGGSERFLATDTHWRPEAMERAAAGLAEFVGRRVALPQSLGVAYRRGEQRVRGRGDLAAMLAYAAPRQFEEVNVRPVIAPDGRASTPRTDADILWLGDSFSNIYSASGMGWGADAGFAEQLSYRLGRPVEAIRRNDNGAFATRQMLAEDLARGDDRLAGKKLVIWQFATRELSQGDWRLIEMVVGQKTEGRLLVPPPGEAWIVSGTVTGKGATPRPGNVAYRDHVMAVMLDDVAVEGRGIGWARAIVYLRSMRDGKLTEAAGVQVGQRLRLRVRDWSEVARQYEFINRSDVPGVQMRGQPVCWGEWLP
jgi:alginate O-acetyltransferase complex protein AlgJ